jgi:hypothetical protein
MGQEQHRTNLEMAGKTQLLAHPDEPLCRVILIPLDRVTVVHWELVVEIMVAFSNGDQSRD